MMKFLVPIDRNTIRENPHAGKRTRFVPGRSTKTETGVVFDVLELHDLEPAPTHFFGYIPTTVTCENCGYTFLHTELCDDEILGNFYENFCPKCHEPECCEIEFECLKPEIVETKYKV
jgi:hypothetical protein